jgi:hypothetical protein
VGWENTIQKVILSNSMKSIINAVNQEIGHKKIFAVCGKRNE